MDRQAAMDGVFGRPLGWLIPVVKRSLPPLLARYLNAKELTLTGLIVDSEMKEGGAGASLF